MVEHVGLDGLQEFRAGGRFLQDIREQLAERGVLGRARLLAVLVLSVEQVDVDGLANQVPQILAREFHKARAQKNVIMDVVNPQS